MRSTGTRLVGREAELAVLSGELSDGAPAGVLVAGEAGIGKSRLLEEHVGSVGPDVAVLRTRAVAAEAQLPYGGLADLLDRVPAVVVEELPAPQREALEVALLRRAAPSAGSDLLAVHLAVLGVLRRVSARQAVLVVVDDVQWLDPETTAALAFVARRHDGDRDRWRVLAAVRVEAPAPVPRLAVLPEPVCRVDLRPLPDDAVAAVLREHLGTSLLPPVRAALVQAAAGNPYLAVEMARQLAERGEVWDPSTALPVPQQLGELLRARLAAVPSPARRVLLAAASSPRPRVDLLALALDVDVEAVLRDAGPVAAVADGAVRLAHPLVGQVLLADATAAERQEAHRRWAEVLDDPVERARHRAFGVPVPDPGVAAELEAAARVAADRAAPHAAADLWQLAADRTPAGPTGDRHRRLVEAAAAHVAVGATAQATQAADAVLAAVEQGPLRARALLARADCEDQNTVRVEPVLQEALRHAADDAPLRAQVLQQLGVLHLVAGDLPAAADSLGAAVAAARAAPGPHLVAALTSTVLIWLLDGRPTDALVEQAVRAEAEHGLLQAYDSPRVVRGLLAGYADAPADAVALLRTACDAADRAGDVYSVVGVRLHLVEALVLAGRGEEALQEARTALEVFGDVAEPGGPQLYPLALAAALVGDAELAERAAVDGEAAAQADADAVFRVQCRYVRGWTALARGDRSAAAVHFRSLRDDAFLRRVQDPAVFRWQADAAEALVAVDALDEAAALLDELEEQAARCGRRSQLAACARSRGLLRAAHGDLAGALDELDRSAALLVGLDLPVQAGRLALVRAGVLRRLRRRGAARDALGEAVTRLAVAPLWQARAEQALDALGLGRTDEPLTAVEQRVATLVAEGMSNPEVGRALFMSPKTVEAHLSRVYRKLGVRGRTALTHALGSAGRGSSPMSARVPAP